MRRSTMLSTLALVAMTAPTFTLASGRIDKGQAIFQQRCGICHSVVVAGGPVLGPTLRGILGRKAGAVPEFKMYSTALAGSNLTWDVKTLDAFLAAPMSKVPGTTMPMPLPDVAERADVIAYLATLKN
ncbi:MAG: c-type cytochrome [Steroidobacteraceae bacterium]